MKTKKNVPFVARSFKVEQTGVEPVSENPSAGISTIIAYLFLFPQRHSGKQAAAFW